MFTVVTLVLAFNVVVNTAIGVPIPDGTSVSVKLLQFISSETNRVGDPVRLAVDRDVVVNGFVVIRRDTPVRGTVVEATRHSVQRWLWWNHVHPGRLTFAVIDTAAVNGATIRLRLVSGRGRSVTPLIRWEHEGELFDARVEGDYLVPPP